MSYILSGDSGTVVFDRTGTITNESPTMSSQVTSNPIEGGGKIYTQIKIDEITNLGAVKVRLRSLLAALEQQEREAI